MVEIYLRFINIKSYYTKLRTIQLFIRKSFHVYIYSISTLQRLHTVSKNYSCGLPLSITQPELRATRRYQTLIGQVTLALKDHESGPFSPDFSHPYRQLLEPSPVLLLLLEKVHIPHFDFLKLISMIKFFFLLNITLVT